MLSAVCVNGEIGLHLEIHLFSLDQIILSMMSKLWVVCC